MTTTLYRTYRPQRFADVVGQEHVTTTLQHQILSGKLAHAYLFCGTRGVGKTTAARLLAKSLNCQQRAAGSAEPCNQCASCRDITLGRSLDLLEIDAASNRRIDDVREIREHIPYGPSRSTYRVVIVDEVHMLTPEAFNALLKTLEEPPPHVVFVLATTEVHKLPETITSRCQRYDFHPVRSELITGRLEKLARAEGVAVAGEVLRDVAYLARGSIRDAESYLGKLIGLGEPTIDRARAELVLPKSDLSLCLEFVRCLVQHEAAAAVAVINRYVAEGGEVGHFHRQVLELLRQLLLVKLGGTQPNALGVETTLAQRLVELSHLVTNLRCQAMLERWLEAMGTGRLSDVPQLPLELAAVALAEPTTVQVPARGTVEPGAGSSARPAATPHVSARGASTALSLRELQQRWPEVVGKLREFNHSLSFILSIAQPSQLEGQTLTVTFQYQLHLERLGDARVQHAISQALRDVVGTELKVRGRLEPPAEGGDLLSSVLTTFGGQVVG